jgi:hypothetical protein
VPLSFIQRICSGITSMSKYADSLEPASKAGIVTLVMSMFIMSMRRWAL